MKTMRQKAIQQVKDMEYSYLKKLVVESHDTNSHKWMEVTPDGNVHETEEADNNTGHYISYPDKPVVSVFNINDESCEACNCDICVMYRHAEDGKEVFIEDYGHTEEEWDYCNKTSQDDAIVEYESGNGGLNAESIREQMIEAIEGIERGYFEDEEEIARFLELVKEEVERIGKGYMCNFWYRNENCHYLNGDNNFCFSVEGDKVHPLVVGGSRFAYPSDFTREEFLAKLKDICLSADEINAAYRKIAGAMGLKTE